MKNKILPILLLFAFQSFALTLEQVKATLAECVLPRDSIEMNLRVSVKATGISQQTDIYLVNKGREKSYTEIKSGFLKQRSIVNGNKMKITDLNTSKSQIQDYNGETLGTDSYAAFHPLDSGEWSEPKFLSDDIYTIQGTIGTLYYNSKKKRIEKMESDKDGANSWTTFSYDVNNRIQKMETSVVVNGQESVVTTEILRMQKSDKIPNSLFDF
ncbi:hypothetical protein [uncultured Fibrobacter sp.]|uniref:hypothetical protein n=1 Tax=uncultured Fibrobacter sp. TaxID=261512 RepID=UPI002592D5D6|nr:hypothetical protein [uncultured Fibrobacter sp.]